jgi:hypothetical protein
MHCLICKTCDHFTQYCTSDRAKTADEAVNNWVYNRFYQRYSSVSEYMKDVHTISTDYYFTRLSMGYLIYLNREFIVDEYLRNQLIYVFLYNSLYKFYRKHKTHNIFAIQSKRMMLIDIEYWRRLLFQSIEEVELWRQTKMQPPIVFSQKKCSHLDSIDCPICLVDGIDKPAAQQYNCYHIFCSLCSEMLLHKSDKCPLCRRQINTVVTFYVWFL